MGLLLTQQNAFYDLINNHRVFTPSQFHFEEYELSGNTHFSLIGTDYYFKIFQKKEYVNSYYANFSPGSSELHEATEIGVINPTIYNYFYSWLDNLEREIKAPNKWERLRREIESFSLPNNSNYNADKFSYQEYTEVASNILLMKDGIKEIGLSPDQFNIINDKLDFLIEQGKSLKKFDWRSLFIGTMMNIMTNVIVNPTTISAFKNLINSFFKKFLT